MEKYPGYNADPKVKKVVDRCKKMGLVDFNKPYANSPKLFKFSTLEKDKCIPSKMNPKTNKKTSSVSGVIGVIGKPRKHKKQ